MDATILHLQVFFAFFGVINFMIFGRCFGKIIDEKNHTKGPGRTLTIKVFKRPELLHPPAAKQV